MPRKQREVKSLAKPKPAKSTPRAKRWEVGVMVLAVVEADNMDDAVRIAEDLVDNVARLVASDDATDAAYQVGISYIETEMMMH